jgi:hypothetical protein
VGPRSGLCAVANRKILILCLELNPDHSACSEVLYPLSHPGSHGNVSERDISFLTLKGIIKWAINVQLQGVCSVTPPAG